jgi:hypothetical protein
MAEVDTDIDRMATKIEGAIFKGLHRHGQVTVAKRLGVAESTVSTAKTESIPKVARMLAACGLKVVPIEAECYPPDYMQALRTFARMAMDVDAPSQRLDWDDK